MKTKNKIPRLHLICSDDLFRPVYNYVLVTKDEVVATNAYLIVIHKTEDIFPNNFVQEMPERFLIYRKHWAQIANKHLSLSFKNDTIVVIREGYNDIYPIQYENRNDFKFPDYNRIFPSERKDLCQIGINIKLLSLFTSAIFLPGDSNRLKLEFYGEDSGIIVRPTDTDNRAKGLIMPVIIS